MALRRSLKGFAVAGGTAAYPNESPDSLDPRGTNERIDEHLSLQRSTQTVRTPRRNSQVVKNLENIRPLRSGATQRQRLCRIVAAAGPSGDKPESFLKLADHSADLVAANDRLEAEGDALIRLHNSRIFPSPELLEIDGNRALRFPYRAGISLGELLLAVKHNGAALELPTKLWIVASTLRAMNEIDAATSSTTHRGFVLLTGGLEGLRITDDGRIVSIGLADVIRVDSQSATTYWTPLTAPEQIVEGHSIDRRADIYAAGALLFHLATLRPMISDRGLNPNIVYRMFRNVHPVPSDVDGRLSDLDPIVRKAVNWLPERRFQDPDEFLEALPPATPVEATDSIRRDLARVCKLALSASRNTDAKVLYSQQILADDRMDPRRIHIE